MKVLWLCNIMLPIIAEHLQREASNKEGWLTGLSAVILDRQKENKIDLGIVFPVSGDLAGFREILSVGDSRLACYGLQEDTARPEIYDCKIEEQLRGIIQDFEPDMVHCFGTEYPHTLAMIRAFGRPERTLIGIQGVCAVYAGAYMADLPERVQKRITLRDYLKQDSLPAQQEKFVRRGVYEKEAVAHAGHITGRTPWDEKYAGEWNPEAKYHFMNETLRSNFYEGEWKIEKCEPYSIFVSQGDYPIKGLHYVMLAMPRILDQYPQAKVYAAGNNIVRHGTLKERLKLSSYGKYLLELMNTYALENKIIFLGRLTADAMKKQYLNSHLFLCPSSIENSPNSVGEAMILGMPIVTADVGGMRGIFENEKDGIMYEGFESSFTPENGERESGERCVKQAHALADAVCRMWEDESRQTEYGRQARTHALKTHDRESNYVRLMAIYKEMQGERQHETV